MIEWLKMLFHHHKYIKTLNFGIITRLNNTKIGEYYVKECEICGKVKRFNTYTKGF